VTKPKTKAKASREVHFGGFSSSLLGSGQNLSSSLKDASSASMLGKNHIRFPSNTHSTPNIANRTVSQNFTLESTNQK
jgi:hypothetical protein